MIVLLKTNSLLDMVTLVTNFVNQLPVDINYILFADSAFGGITISADLIEMKKI